MASKSIYLTMSTVTFVDPAIQNREESLSLQNLALSTEGREIAPPLPEKLDDTGLSGSVIEQLILKLLYTRGEMLGRDLSEAVGLKFSLVEEFIEFFKRQHFIQAKKSMGMGNSTSVFALAEAGRDAARDAMENNQYTGAAPVPLHQYSQMVRKQRRNEGWLTPDALAHAYRKMVMTPRILSQIGPAVSSGNSFLIYGQPGNGKSYLAEALGVLDDSCIYVPYAIESQGIHHSGLRSHLSSTGRGGRTVIHLRFRTARTIAAGSSAAGLSSSPAAN